MTNQKQHSYLSEKLGQAIRASILHAPTPENSSRFFELLDRGTHRLAAQDLPVDARHWFEAIRKLIEPSTEDKAAGHSGFARRAERMTPVEWDELTNVVCALHEYLLAH